LFSLKNLKEACTHHYLAKMRYHLQTPKADAPPSQTLSRWNNRVEYEYLELCIFCEMFDLINRELPQFVDVRFDVNFPARSRMWIWYGIVSSPHFLA
jgi:hypothetical protein